MKQGLSSTMPAAANGSVATGLAFATALACACVFCGAVPWLTVPTLGQSLWASGFAQSYANADHLSLYAHDIGFPHPAPIAFGLPATFLQGLFIRWLGIPAIDAYTLATVCWLALALWGAMAFARSLGAPPVLAIAAGLLWLSLPMIWQHVAYSMLSLGFALLPLYLHAARKLFDARSRSERLVAALAFCMACVLSLFMDGYTFMMFAVACAVFWLGNAIAAEVPRRRLLAFVAPAMAAGFALAYGLYTAYIGGEDYAVAPLDFFRGWGVDVVMLLQPTRGRHVVWDWLGLSAVRSPATYWGDGSVWMTTFVAPMLVAGVAGWLFTRPRTDARMLLALAIVGTYLSLGPSLKANTRKQAVGVPATVQTMAARYALAPTGSAALSMHVPGFSQMRASYRWIALGEVGFWGLAVLLLVRLRTRPVLAFTLVGVLVAAFLPHVPRVLRDGAGNRRKADTIAATFVPGLREVAGEHGRLFFAPFANDFIASYVVPLAGLTSYNIGGDKNVAIASTRWSRPMRELSLARLGSASFPANIRRVLLAGEVDAVVLPYYDPVLASMIWPVDPRTVVALRGQRLPVAQAAAQSPCFQLRQFPLFATVSLSLLGRAERERFAAGHAREVADQCTPAHAAAAAPGSPDPS
jgi:hypothetical protein